MVTMDQDTLSGVISRLSGIIAQLTVDKALAETQRDRLQAKLDARLAEAAPEVSNDVTDISE